MAEKKNNTTKQFQYFPGHMKKAINRIEELCKVIDGAIIVLDSRAPISSYPTLILDVLKKNNVKNIVYVLSHKDQVDINKLKVFLNQQQSINNKCFVVDLNKNDSVNDLIKYLSNIKGSNDDKYFKLGFPLPLIDFLVVGIPNVGKSTLINNLKKKKVAQVENTPGKTRALTLFKISKRVEVIDSPGILEPNYNDKEVIKKLCLLGSVNLEAIPFDDLFEYLVEILKKDYYQEVLIRYNIDSFETSLELSDKVGKSKLILTKGGISNIDLVKMTIFKDFQKGLLGKIYLD